MKFKSLFIAIFVTSCSFAQISRSAPVAIGDSCSGLLEQSDLPEYWIQVGNPITKLSITSSNYVVCRIDLERHAYEGFTALTASLASTSYDSTDNAIRGFDLTSVPTTMMPGFEKRDYLRSQKADEQDFGCWESKPFFYYCEWAGRYGSKIEDLSFELPFDKSSFELLRDETRSKLKIFQELIGKIDNLENAGQK